MILRFIRGDLRLCGLYRLYMLLCVNLCVPITVVYCGYTVGKVVFVE